MINVTDQLLTVNKYSRPGRKLDAYLGLIYHYTSIRFQRAQAVFNYFETDSPNAKHYSSAHDCIDLDGHVLHFVPYDEVAYHCGSENIDPHSKKIYTDWARDRFPKYTLNPTGTSPNLVTIGIELCFNGANGEFAEATLEAAAELGASLCTLYGIPLENVGTHHHVVGWKDCPLYWTKYPEEFEKFRQRIEKLIG